MPVVLPSSLSDCAKSPPDLLAIKKYTRAKAAVCFVKIVANQELPELQGTPSVGGAIH